MGRATPATIGAGGAAMEGDVTSVQDRTGGSWGVLDGGNSVEYNGDVT